MNWKSRAILLLPLVPAAVVPLILALFLGDFDMTPLADRGREHLRPVVMACPTINRAVIGGMYLTYWYVAMLQVALIAVAMAVSAWKRLGLFKAIGLVALPIIVQAGALQWSPDVFLIKYIMGSLCRSRDWVFYAAELMAVFWLSILFTMVIFAMVFLVPLETTQAAFGQALKKLPWSKRGSAD